MDKFKMLLSIVAITSMLLSNGCIPSFDWGSIEYNHDLIVNYGGFQQNIKVTGTIPLSSRDVQLVDPGSMYTGTGTLSVSVSGTAGECTISGSATNSVSLKGNEFLQQLFFTFEEQWYQNGSFTLTCPGGTQTIPLPGQTISFPLIFPVQDGYTIEQPFSGAAGSGTYRWTLHIES